MSKNIDKNKYNALCQEILYLILVTFSLDVFEFKMLTIKMTDNEVKII